MAYEKHKELAEIDAAHIGLRLDHPNGDWLWERLMIIGLINGGNKSKRGLKPHVVFNGIALPIRAQENVYLELIETNPQGLDKHDVKRLIPSITSMESARSMVFGLRQRMRVAFNQDLLDGHIAWYPALGPRHNPRERTNITYKRANELK